MPTFSHCAMMHIGVHIYELSPRDRYSPDAVMCVDSFSIQMLLFGCFPIKVVPFAISIVGPSTRFKCCRNRVTSMSLKAHVQLTNELPFLIH